MINYDKWKLLNENFMISQPIGGIKSNNGFLAYNKLHEDEEIEEEEVEEEDMDDEGEEDMEDMDDEGDEDMEDMDDEGDEDMEDMDDEGDEDMDDEDMDDMDDEDMDDMDDEGGEDIDDMDDEDEHLMGRVRSIHHPDAHKHKHPKHREHMHDRPHHKMDVDEIDFANAASEKYSKMYASCESMDYKLPPMNEWLASVNGQMFPEQLQEYIGKKDVSINEAQEEKLTGKMTQLNQKIDQLAEKQSITRVEFMSAIRHFIQALEPKVSGGLPSMAKRRLDQFLEEVAKVVEDGDSKKEEPSEMKHMKKGKDKCGYSMRMMGMNKGKVHPKHMKMSKKKMGKGCMDAKMKGHMKSHMKKGWKG
jgi:hypothetical protein